MTINDMIKRLEEYRDLHGPNCEVRLMTQQAWPFENTIHGVCTNKEMIDDGDDEDENDDEDEPVVYLVEGSQIGYGSKTAWRCC